MTNSPLQIFGRRIKNQPSAIIWNQCELYNRFMVSNGNHRPMIVQTIPSIAEKIAVADFADVPDKRYMKLYGISGNMI